ATWLGWPHETSDWPGKFSPIPWLYGDIVRHLSEVERVRILVENADAKEKVRKILEKCHANLSAVDLYVCPTDRSWVRDTMAIFVHDAHGKVAATNGAQEAATTRVDYVAGGERGAALFLLGRAASAGLTMQSQFAAPNQAGNQARLAAAAILKQREEALTALAATYVELAALASADPGANVRKASAELVDKANGLATTVNTIAGGGAIPLITKTAGAVFGEVAALYAEERQRQEILVTNGIIREALNVLRRSLDRESEFVEKIQEEVAVARGALGAAALNQGLVDQSATVARIAELAGFNPISNTQAALAGARADGDNEQKRRQRLVWALAEFEKFRAAAKAAAVKEARDTLNQALAKLDAGHAKIAERQPFGAEEALTLAMALKDAVARIRAAEEGK
ncbi:MAG: agmatine deiminase family protein, partial [Alphaproteobacteria bacterium]|nr:agmatine deiminase family protein [Alphaproteobacteria bacterium]